MKSFFNNHKAEICIFILALIIRLVFFFISLNVNGGNLENTIHGKDWYFEISKNLFLGNGFSAETSAPFTEYSYGVPGYPYFLYFLLLVSGGSYGFAVTVQLLLGTFIPIIGMYLVRLLLPFKRVSIVVGLLLAFAPYQILFSHIFYTETLFTALFGVFLILFLKFLVNPSLRLTIWSSMFLALATLTKPTIQYFIIFVPFFILWHFRKNIDRNVIRNICCFVVLFFVVISPWLYRNYKTFDTIALSTQVSFNLSTTLLPSVLAIEDGVSFNESRSKYSRSSSSESALAEIFNHPVALAKLMMLSSVTFFTHDGMLSFLQAVGIRPGIYLEGPALLLFLNSPVQFFKIMLPYMQTSMAFIFFFRLLWIGITLFFIVGIYKIWHRGLFSSQVAFSIFVVFYFMLTTMINGITVNARFRMPVEPLIFAIAYAGFVFVYKYVKSKRALDSVSKLEF